MEGEDVRVEILTLDPRGRDISLSFTLLLIKISSALEQRTV